MEFPYPYISIPFWYGIPILIYKYTVLACGVGFLSLHDLPPHSDALSLGGLLAWKSGVYRDM